MSKILIQKLTVEDVEAYRDIRLEMLKDTPEAFGESHEESSRQTLGFFKERLVNSAIFGAFEESRLVGSAGYFIQKGLKSCHKAFLWGVYVKPENRGHGISYDLTMAVLENLPENIELIQAAFVKGNLAAEKTYRKAGFQDWGIEEKALKVNGKLYDEIHMVHFLKQEHETGK